VSERPRPWERRVAEARAVRKISVAVGLSALGLSCGLATASAKQGADIPAVAPDIPAVTPTQPSPVAAEPRQVEEIDEEIIVPVYVPRPPEQPPAAAPRAAPVTQPRAAQAGSTTVTQAAPAARAAVAQKPTAVSTGSPVR
jgi:hypothetical protein